MILVPSVPDPLSMEAFKASTPDINAKQASDKERASRLSLLAGTENEIIKELCAKKVSRYGNLLLAIRTTQTDLERPSTHAIKRLHYMLGMAHHVPAQEVLKHDLNLAIAIGAIADATTATDSYRTATVERFERAADTITDPRIPTETRLVLGAFLVDRAVHG
jgi:hypothetical protein